MCVKRKGNSGTWHRARDPEYSQLYINFQTRSHWKTVIWPQNGNKSAHLGFCHGDPRARWPAESMDQGQDRRGGVWGKEIGGNLASQCVFVSERPRIWKVIPKGFFIFFYFKIITFFSSLHILRIKQGDPSVLICVERFIEFINKWYTVWIRAYADVQYVISVKLQIEGSRVHCLR